MPTTVATAADAASPNGRGHPRRCRRRRDRKSRAMGANAGADEGSEESACPELGPRPHVEVEYVPEKPDLAADDPLLLGAFAAVFEKFGLTDHTAAATVEQEEANTKHIHIPASKEEGGWSVIQKGSNERGEKNRVDKEMEGERENYDTVEGLIEAEAGSFSEEMVDLPSQVPNGAVGDAGTTRKAST